MAEDSLTALCGLGTAGPNEAARYLREAHGMEIDWRAADLSEMQSHLLGVVSDYLMERRRLCRDLHTMRREAAYVMRSLRVDSLLPYRRDSTYDPIGGFDTANIPARVRALGETEKALGALVRAYAKDTKGE